MVKSKRTTFLVYFSLLLVVGSGGFYLIGGAEWSITDSIYMTIITFSTVGFNEIHPLTPWGQVWAILVIIFGVGGFLTLITQIGVDLMEFNKYRRRTSERKIHKLKDHYIICGYGRMGAVIADELHRQKKPFVLLENKPEKVERIQDKGYTFLQADATLDETLLAAGIERAAGIVVTLGTDQDNLFVAMAARSLNKEAFLLSRCAKHDTGIKLKRAGANKVVNPYIAGGHKMAELLLSPFVEDSVAVATPDEDLDLVIEEFNLQAFKRYEGRMIKDSSLREDFNLIIVGLINGKGETHLNPDPHTILHSDQTIMVIGSKENLEAFKASVNK